MGYPKIVKDAKGVMYVNFTHMAYGLLHATFIIIEQHLLVLPHLQQPAHCLIFLIYTRTLKQDDLAAAFSATSLTELEQNYSSGLAVENNTSLFAEIPKYFYFVYHPKR